MRRHPRSVPALCAFAAIVTGAVVAQAQVCSHKGRVMQTMEGAYVCSGEFLTSTCTWTDDCRKNVE